MHSVYPTQYTSRMETTRAKKTEEADKNNSKIVRNIEGKNLGTIRVKCPKQGLISAKDLTIMINECRDTPYHRSDYTTVTILTYLIIYGPWGQWIYKLCMETMEYKYECFFSTVSSYFCKMFEKFEFIQ